MKQTSAIKTSDIVNWYTERHPAVRETPGRLLFRKQ